MAKKNIDENISIDEIEYRTKLADCIIKEIKAKKDAIDLESKHRNICRIDVALAEFNRICAFISDALRGFPDTIQAIIPSMSPEQYKQVQDFIQSQLNILYNNQLHLTLTPLEETRAAKREEMKEYRRGKDDADL